MKRVLFSLAAALALAVPSFAQVAQIGDATYDTLAAAFADATTGNIISLVADTTVENPIEVPAGKTLTLNLGTYTVTATNTSNEAAIKNAGNLTIRGSYDSPRPKMVVAEGAARSLIENTGTLAVSSQYAICATDGVTPEGLTLEGRGVPVIRNTGTMNIYPGAVITLAEGTDDYAIVSSGTRLVVSKGYANAKVPLPQISGPKGILATKGYLTVAEGTVSATQGPAVLVNPTEGAVTAFFGPSCETATQSATIVSSAGDAVVIEGSVTNKPSVTFRGNATYRALEGKAAVRLNAQSDELALTFTYGIFEGAIETEAGASPLSAFIKRATFSVMPDTTYLAPGFIFAQNDDGSFGVIEGTYIASIGDVKYADFNSFLAAFKAIAASETPTTVTLLADLTGELAVPGVVPVKAGRNIVFDLNGHTMETALQQGSSTKHYYAIENSGTLTIKDSSAAQTGTIRARGVSNFAQGNLTVEGGTIIAIDSDKGAALWNEGYAIVSGGKVIVEDLVGNLPAIRNEKNATLVVKGGEVQGQSRPAVINVGTMTIEGGLLWNTQCNVTSDGKHKSPWYYAVLVGGNGNASLKMTGGTIRGTQGALTFIAGKGELTGGRCETVPCIYHGDTGGNIWHALYLSTTEGPVDVTVGGDFVAQSDGREAFVIGGNNEDTQKYTCKATVTGGTFIGDEESGFAALRVNNQRKDGVEPIIQGGHFEGGIESVADTGFEPITNFVSGGTFSEAVELGCCAEGFIPVVGTEGKYTVDGTAVAAVANTEAPGTYKGYGTLAELVKGVTTNGTEVLIVKSEALGEEVKLLKTATGGDNAEVQDSEIVYAYQLGIADLDVTESGISVTVRLEEDGTAVTRTLEGRKVRVVSDKTVLAEADAIFTDGACVLTVPAANLPAGNLELTISVAPAAEAETLAE